MDFAEPKHAWKYLNRELPPLPEQAPNKPLHNKTSSIEMVEKRAKNHSPARETKNLDAEGSISHGQSAEILPQGEKQPSYKLTSTARDLRLPSTMTTDNEKRTHRLMSIVPQTLPFTDTHETQPFQASFDEFGQKSSTVGYEGKAVHILRPGLDALTARGQSRNNNTPYVLYTVEEGQNHPPETNSLYRSKEIKEQDWVSSSTKKSGDLYSTSSTSARFTSSNGKMRPLPQLAASVFMGNFVPLERSSESARLGNDQHGTKIDQLTYYEKVSQMNPFSNKIAETLSGGTQQTGFGNSASANSARSLLKDKRPTHLKNSQSESNALLMTQPQAHRELPPPLPSGRKLSRSESSPSISPLRQFPRREESPSPTRPQHGEHTPFRSRARSKSNAILSPKNTDDILSTPFRSMRNRSTSPTKNRMKGATQQSEVILEGLHDQPDRPEPPPRSRSPIKRMFGEGGWLGTTTDSKEGASNRYKKPGMMIYIKNKIEEFGQKADLSPTKNGTNREITHRPSKVPISLSPSQQAGLYSDLELTICTVANRFLMVQYQEGRVSVDSLKKVTDFWSSKGRPQVVEFQYDQATQRDLILANLKSFQFHGIKGSNPHYIDAMLYNWKEHARSMSVRTFCYPDSVIQKQLHDTYLLLELLGAPRETFVGLRNIQEFFNTTVERAREKKQSTDSSGTGGTTSTSAKSRHSAEGREYMFDVTDTIATYYEIPDE